MTNLAHIAETAILVLVAYLLGCALGYGARRVLYAARVTRKVIAVPVVTAPAAPLRPRTPAARLAAAASSDEILPPTPVPPPLPAKPKAIDPKPVALTAARDGQADNLKQIKGIGPKIEASLNALGIFHIDQIAAWTKANVDWVDGQLAFKGRIRRERWVEQAIEFGKVKA